VLLPVRIAQGKKEKLDMSYTVVVNYNSMGRAEFLELTGTEYASETLTREQKRNEFFKENET